MKQEKSFAPPEEPNAKNLSWASNQRPIPWLDILKRHHGIKVSCPSSLDPLISALATPNGASFNLNPPPFRRAIEFFDSLGFDQIV